MPAIGGQMLLPSIELNKRMLCIRGQLGFKMLGALAAGAVLGLLVGLPCGQEGDVPALCTIVQALAAISVPTRVLLDSLRWPVEPFRPPNVRARQGEA